MRVTLEKISRQPKTSKSTGKDYLSVGIMVNGEWYNGFSDPFNGMWKSGDVVDVELINEGQYKNFKTINPIHALEARVAALESKVFGINQNTAESTQNNIPNFNDEDIPF